MRYALRKLKRQVERLEQRPLTFSALAEAVQRYLQTGELPTGGRTLAFLRRRACILAEMEAATAGEKSGVSSMLDYHFDRRIGDRFYPVIHYAAGLVARGASDTVVIRSVQTAFGVTLNPAEAKKLLAFVDPLAWLIRKAIVVVPTVASSE